MTGFVHARRPWRNVVIIMIAVLLGSLVCLIVFGIWWYTKRPTSLQVIIQSVEIDREDSDQLTVILKTDKDFPALQGGDYSRNIMVTYSVDENASSAPHPYDLSRYDLQSITFQRPFIAVQTGPTERDGPWYVTHWIIPLRGESQIPPLNFEYSLDDGKQHVIHVEIYGADYTGGYVRSNVIDLKYSGKP
jgi:hypothetical protein